MMLRVLAFLPFLALGAVPLFAQPPISGVVNPPVVSPGQPVTLTITGFQNVSLPSPCVYQDVLVGSPSGPSILQILCLAVVTPLNAGSSLSDTWTPSQAGTYWLRVRIIGYPDQHFCVEVRNPGSQLPTLSATTSARVGQDLVLALSAPLLPGAPYVAAASLTSNVGIPLDANTVACLDPDPIFDLSFPNPHPAVFTSFLGGTDASGMAGGITVHIPNDPLLLYLPLKVQVAIIDPTTLAPRLSNGLAFSIQP